MLMVNSIKRIFTIATLCSGLFAFEARADNVTQSTENGTLIVDIRPVENMKIVDDKKFEISTLDGGKIKGDYHVYVPYMKMTRDSDYYSLILHVDIEYTYKDKTGKELVSTYANGSQSLQLPVLNTSKTFEERFMDDHQIDHIYFSLKPDVLDRGELNIEASSHKTDL